MTRPLTAGHEGQSHHCRWRRQTKNYSLQRNSTRFTSIMVERVLFRNSLGHPAFSDEKTKEEGGHAALVKLLCAGQRGGGSRTNRPWRDMYMWYMSFDNLIEGRILDFMMEGIRQEGRGGEALWTTPTKERKPPRKLEKNRLCLVAGHEGRKDTKGRRS
jgi:hypothetical protein